LAETCIFAWFSRDKFLSMGHPADEMSVMDPVLRAESSDLRQSIALRAAGADGPVAEAQPADGKILSLSNDHANPRAVLSTREIRRNAVYLPFLDKIRDLLRMATRDFHVKEEISAEEAAEEDALFQALEEEADDGHSAEEEDDQEPKYMLQGYIVGPKEFEVLSERLPAIYGEFRVKYDMFDGRIAVRMCPSRPHARVTGLFEHTIIDWQRDPADPTPSGRSLVATRDEGSLPSRHLC
jgi:hypothetical protein